MVVPTEFLVLFFKTYNVWFACMSNHSNLIIWLQSPIAINHSVQPPLILHFQRKNGTLSPVLADYYPTLMTMV